MARVLKNGWTKVLQYEKEWMQIPEAKQAIDQINMTKALPLWQRTLEISKHAMGHSSPMTQAIGAQVAHCYIELGQYKQAEPFLEQYMPNKIAALYLVQGKDIDALERVCFEDEAQQLELQNIHAVLRGSSSRARGETAADADALVNVSLENRMIVTYLIQQQKNKSLAPVVVEPWESNEMFEIESDDVGVVCFASELDYAHKAYPRGMERLTRALRTTTDERDLGRILYRLADGYHRLGEAVTAEGLFTTAIDHLKKHAHPTNMAHVLDHAQALDKYKDLLLNWEKRISEAEQIQTESQVLLGQAKALQGSWTYPLSSMLVNIPFLR